MKRCVTEFQGDYLDTELHCVTHDKPASHLATNGDDWVCATHVDENGCNCCPVNEGRWETNQKLYKAAWDLLTVEQQSALRRMIENQEK